MNTDAQDTHLSRLRKYERRERQITWIGAGLLGLIAIVAGDLGAGVFGGVPRILTGVLLTLIILAAASLAQARSEFEWQATLISRAIDDQPDVKNRALPADKKAWPGRGEALWIASVLLTVIAGIWSLVCIWWYVFAEA
jgi:hypothetical protein